MFSSARAEDASRRRFITAAALAGTTGMVAKLAAAAAPQGAKEFAVPHDHTKVQARWRCGRRRVRDALTVCGAGGVALALIMTAAFAQGYGGPYNFGNYPPLRPKSTR